MKNSDFPDYRRLVIKNLILSKSKNLYKFILNKYKNYIYSIIDKYLLRCGLLNNIYVEKDIIFSETIEAIFKINEEKFLEWELKTLIGHTAVFTTSKYVRHYNTTKKKINLLCGNQTEGSFEVAINNSNYLTEISSVSNFEINSIIKSILDSTLNKKEKQNVILNKIVYLKLLGESNSAIGKKLKLPRRVIYDKYKRWFSKNKTNILKLLCLE